MQNEPIDWWERTKLWRTAYYILREGGARAVPIGEAVSSCGKGGGRDFEEWAISLRAVAEKAAGTEEVSLVMDDFYECVAAEPSKAYKSMPREYRPMVRRAWKGVEQNGQLMAQGRRIVAAEYGENDKFLNCRA